MSLFLPKRLLVKPQSKHSKRTQEIIARTQKYNQNVQVEYLPSADFKYPVSTPREKFLYMKESAIISERSEDFIRTFDSPGNIVESLTTVLNLSWMCASRCEYCYLQTNQTPEHYFYTNLDKAEHEIASSPAAHAAILTLWTQLSAYFGYRLIKLPDRFKEAADWLREYFVTARVSRDADAIDRYYLIQNKLVDQINTDNKSYQVDSKRFTRDRKTINQWYIENKKIPLTLTASEFNDFLAVDHLTDNSAFLMEALEKYPRFNFTIRSKSSYVDGFLRFDGLDRARFNISLNTDYVIREFEHGTATLDERLQAARKIQEAKGFPLSIVIEPMMKYENHSEDYRKLVQRALTELNPERINTFILGSVRYADQLKTMVRLHFPETKLFNEDQPLVAPTKPDTKNRYDPAVRRKLYSEIVAEIRSRSVISVKLGTETPELWETLGMNQDKELGDKVYEPGNGDATPPSQSNPAESTEKSVTPKEIINKHPLAGKKPTKQKDGSSSYWMSIAPQEPSMLEPILGERDESIPLDRFAAAVERLHSMATIREVRAKGTDDILGYDVNDRWEIEETETLNNLIAKQVYFEPVKIIGRIVAVSSFVPHEIDDLGTRSFVTATIADNLETTIETLDICGDRITVNLSQLQRDRTRCTFYGAIVPLYGKSVGRSRFRFYLHDMKTDIRPIDLVPWTPTEEDPKGFGIVMDARRYGLTKDHPHAIVLANKGPNGIINYLKAELVEHLGIQALQDATQLERALEFVILQSFSQGRTEFLEKLHGLIIGPPNVGKAYLTRAALILNSIGQEISGGRKVTDAGLVGTVRAGGKKNTSEPGILPLNHGGVVCLQEFHDVHGMTRKTVCGRFVRMMEEGQVIESTTAATVHPAETALLIDQNRYSQIDLSGHFTSYSDIDIPINMLARFDYIVEIKRDKARSEKTAAAMGENFGEMGRKRSADEEQWKLRLKYLVAFLKTEYTVITLPVTVRDHLHSAVDAMLADIPGDMQTLVEDMRLRLERSAFKLTKAVATANASSIATKDHADYALRFVQDKIDFILDIKTDDLRMAASEERPSISELEKRREIIENAYRGKQFLIDDVMKLLQDQMDGECDKKTIQRDLTVLGGKPLTKPKGSWSLR